MTVCLPRISFRDTSYFAFCVFVLAKHISFHFVFSFFFPLYSLRSSAILALYERTIMNDYLSTTSRQSVLFICHTRVRSHTHTHTHAQLSLIIACSSFWIAKSSAWTRKWLLPLRELGERKKPRWKLPTRIFCFVYSHNRSPPLPTNFWKFTRTWRARFRPLLFTLSYLLADISFVASIRTYCQSRIQKSTICKSLFFFFPRSSIVRDVTPERSRGILRSLIEFHTVREVQAREEDKKISCRLFPKVKSRVP